MPHGGFQATLQHCWRQLFVHGGKFARFIFGKRSELQTRHWRTVAMSLPARRELPFVSARRQCDQHWAGSSRGDNAGQLGSLDRRRPVHVFDDEQQWLCSGALEQVLQGTRASLLPVRIIHGCEPRRRCRRHRRSHELADEKLVVLVDETACNRALDRCGASCAIRVGRDAEQSQPQCRERTLHRGLPEVEDLQLVHRDALLHRKSCQRIDERRFAYPGFAAHGDGSAPARLDHAFEKGREQRQFRAAADEVLAPRLLARSVVQPIHLECVERNVRAGSLKPEARAQVVRGRR
jgi:hypothetical protein